MPTNRTILVTVLVAALLTVSGCSALEGGDSSDLDAERVLNQTQGSMQDVESFAFDADMSMSTQQSNQPVNVSASGVVDVAAGEGRAEITAATGQTIPFYVVDNTMYMKQSGVWVKQSFSNATEMAGGQITPQPQATPSQQLMNATSVTFEGNTTIDGQDVYELSVNVSEEQIQNVLEEQQSGQMGSMMAFEDMSYTVYVTHDQHYLKRLSADMTMSVMGQSTDADMQVTLSEFDEAVSIELPAAAQNAQPMTATG